MTRIECIKAVADNGGFMTGSRAFGGGSGGSDFDYCLPRGMFDQLLAALKADANPIDKCKYFDGVYVCFGDGLPPVNLIPVDAAGAGGYAAWWYATERMKALAAAEPWLTRNKAARIILFDWLREAHAQMEHAHIAIGQAYPADDKINNINNGDMK